MNKVQRSINLIAILAYILLGVMLFVSITYSVLILIGLMLFTIVLAKNEEDNKAIIPVTGAVGLYFAYSAVKVVFTIFDRIISKIQSWRLEGLEEKIKDYSGEKLEKYIKQHAKLVERIEADTFGEVVEVIMFLLAIGVIALCALSVISLLSGKDFRSSIVGKIVSPVVVGKDAAKVNSICPNCGKVIKGEFCANCGTKKQN